MADAVTPARTGRKLAKEADAAVPELKVLLTSGSARNAIVPNGTLALGVELIVKPITWEGLAGKIVSMLAQ
jgi:hypothetical protein